jgi:hypothetical protein
MGQSARSRHICAAVPIMEASRKVTIENNDITETFGFGSVWRSIGNFLRPNVPTGRYEASGSSVSRMIFSTAAAATRTSGMVAPRTARRVGSAWLVPETWI